MGADGPEVAHGSMLRNFLVSFFAFAFCKELPWGTMQVLTWTVLSSHPAPCPRKPTVLATIPTIWTRSSEIHNNTYHLRERNSSYIVVAPWF